MFTKELSSGNVDLSTLVFLICLILIIISAFKLFIRLSQKKKITGWLLILGITFAIGIFTRIDFEDSEIYIIPEGYVGQVNVIFEPCGEKITYDNKNRVYVIQNNGVFITKAPFQASMDHQQYFYSGKNGKAELTKMDKIADERGWWKENSPRTDTLRDKIGIYEVGHNGDNMQFAHVCSFNQYIDSFFTKDNIAKEYAFRDSIIKKCREER